MFCFIPAMLCDDISCCGFQAECRLQMEAQHISLSQIHAAQLELLQEDTDARTHSLELKLQELRDHGDRGEQSCAVSCLGVHLCVCGKTGVPFKEAFDLSFMIHPNRRGICIQHCYCTSLVIVCVCHGASVKHYHLNFSINSKFLLFFFLSDEPKIFKCNNISRAVTKECSEIIQVFIEHKPISWSNFITVCCRVTNVFNLVSVCSVFSVFKRCLVKSFWRVVIQRDGRPLQWKDQKLVNAPPLYWRPEVICLLKK